MVDRRTKVLARRWIGLVALLSVIASSCAVDLSSNGGSNQGKTNLEQLAAQMAMPDQNRFVVGLTDFERAFDQFGYDLALSCDGEDRFISRLVEIDSATGVTGQMFARYALEEPGDFATSFGPQPCEVKATGDYFQGATLYMQVTTEQGVIGSAVANDDRWSDNLASEASDSGTRYDWGDEMDLERRSGARPLGRGGQLFIGGETMVRTVQSEEMDRFVDASIQRLDETDAVGEVIAYLEGQGAYALILTDEGQTVDAFGLLTDPQPLEGEALVAWTLLGFGVGLNDAGEQRLHVSIVHASESDAQMNESRFRDTLESGTSLAARRPWSDVLRIESIAVDGVQVQATLFSDQETPLLRFMLNVIIQGDSLFVVES